MSWIDEKQAAEILKKADNVAIFVHKNPDGDAMGSGFGLYHMLTDMGKKAVVYSSDGAPELYGYLSDGCPVFQEGMDFVPDYYVSVDVADPKLLGKYEEFGEKMDLCIDHHISNLNYAKHTLLHGEAASATEVLYGLMEFLPIPMTKEIADCLYTGLATDTGCFKYQNTSANTHRVAAMLMEAGTDYAEINRKMFDTKSRSRIRAEGLLLDKLQFFAEGKIAIAVITKENIEEYHLTSPDFDGISGIPRQVEGVEIGITVRQLDDNVYKASCRSSVYADVSAMCRSLGGGGHIRAAGCEVKGTQEEIVKILVETAEKFI